MIESRRRAARAIGAAVVCCFLALAAAPAALAGHFSWDQNHDAFQPDDPTPPPPEEDPDCNDQGSPFRPATGAYLYSYQELAVGSLGPEILLSRTYNSLDRRNGPLGPGWTHTYDVRLIDVTDGVTVSAVCRKGTGKRFRFLRNPDGSYTPPSDFFAELDQLPNGTFTLEEFNGTTKIFDADGLLTAIEDREGNQMTLAYDPAGFLVSITNAAGGQVDLVKGANGKIASITDPMGRTFDYGYDGDGRLTSVTNPLSEATTFVYGGDGRLDQILDPLGRAVQDLSYDGEGRLTGYIENGVVWTVAYSPAESKVTKTNPLGAAWQIFFNENGNVVERVDPLGGRRTFGYDANYRITAETGETGAQTDYQFDARGNITSETDALGNTTTSVYDLDTGLLLSTTSPGGNTRVYTYTAQRLTRIEDDEGLLLTFEYYPSGRVHRQLDANGKATTYTYDARGLLETITSAEGGVTAFEYDAVGNQTAVTDADGLRSEYVYDDLDRVVTERDPSSNETTYAYGPLCPLCGSDALRTSKIDASGRLTEWEYDRYGRLTRTIYPNLTETSVTYDAAGNVATRVDRAGGVTAYTYDALDRLVAVAEPGGAASTMTYDAAGWMTAFIDAEGETTTYSYDAIGQLTGLASASAGSTARTYTANGVVGTQTDARGIQVTYAYDARDRVVGLSFPDPQENILYRWDEATSSNGLGRLTSIDDPSGTTRYHYDGDGRLATVESTVGGVTHTLEYAYTPAGRPAAFTYPSGTGVIYHRDARGLVQAIDVDEGGVVRTVVSAAAYDPDGRHVSLTYGNGLVETRSYDSAGQLESIDVATVDHVVFGRDPRDNLTAASDQLDPSRNRTYGYDQRARLTSATGPWGAVSYTYDEVGNRLTRAGPAGTATYQYSGNRLTSISGAQTASYSYDAAGNVLSDGARDYQYSQFGRLASVRQGGVEQASYAYNASSQRVVEQTASTATVYLYDEQGRLIEEADAAGNTLATHLYWNTWQPLARLVAGDLQFFHSDHQGTPKVVTDATQSEIWRGELYPFGAVFQESGTVEQDFRLPGQTWDANAQLSYNWYRWYAPETGRYTSVDPLGIEGGGPNLYLYGEANPLANTDPDGRLIPRPCKPGDVQWCQQQCKQRNLQFKGCKCFGVPFCFGLLDFAVAACKDTQPGCKPCPPPPPPEVHYQHGHGNCKPGQGHFHYFEYHQGPPPECICRLQRRFGGCV